MGTLEPLQAQYQSSHFCPPVSLTPPELFEEGLWMNSAHSEGGGNGGGDSLMQHGRGRAIGKYFLPPRRGCLYPKLTLDLQDG